MLQAVKNEIMGEAPQSSRKPVDPPRPRGAELDDLKYISGKIEEYAAEVQAMLDTKAQERLAELKARIAADQNRTGALQPQPPRWSTRPPQVSRSGEAREHVGWARKTRLVAGKARSSPQT